jgi:hypothetical protein
MRLRSAIKPKVIDASNPDKEPKYNPGMNILIGGNRLGRGCTIEGLDGYLLRARSKAKSDGYSASARTNVWLSTRTQDVTRLFLPQHILEDFRAIHEADEGMRQAIGDDPSNIKIKPVWVGRKLQATRSNVLNPAAIGAFTPGLQTFPRDPLWKASEIRKSVEELDKLLEAYEDKGEDGEFHEVEIDFLIEILSHMKSRYYSGYPWEDKRIRELLSQMKSQGIPKGMLNIFRGKTLKGRALKRQEPSEWGGFGFTNGRVLGKIKKRYPNIPTLAVFYQQGEESDGWGNQPLYLPMLIPPKSKFVFMFNYSDEPEEIEDDSL